MGGTKEGARKAYLTRLSKDPDFMSRMGKKGGVKSSPKKGFGTNRELAKMMGKKYGKGRKKHKGY